MKHKILSFSFSFYNKNITITFEKPLNIIAKKKKIIKIILSTNAIQIDFLKR